MVNTLKNNAFFLLLLTFAFTTQSFSAKDHVRIPDDIARLAASSIILRISYEGQTKGMLVPKNIGRDPLIRNYLRPKFDLTTPEFIAQNLILSLDGKSMNLNEHSTHAEGGMLNSNFLPAAQQLYGRALVDGDTLILSLQPKEEITVNLMSKINNALADIKSSIKFQVNAPIRTVFNKIVAVRNINLDAVESIILTFNNKEFNLTRAMANFPSNCFSCKAGAAFGASLKDGDRVEVKVINKKP